MSKITTAQAVVVFGILFSVAIVALGVFAMNSDIYIKSIGGNELSNGGMSNTISVSGDGKVYAKPNMVSFSISVAETKDTSKAALDTVNDRVAQIQKVLKGEGIDEKDIQTTDLSIYPQYEWRNNSSVLVGQRAAQTVSVKVKKIDEKATKAATVIDKVSEVEKVEINSISFDIEDKTDLFTQAREEAFKKAEQKAKELSKLGDVKLLKPISISDSNVEYTPVTYQNVASFEKAADSAAGNSTSISTGQLEIRSSLSVVFGIE